MRLGRESALLLARAGWQVAIHYRTSTKEAAQTLDDCRAAGARAVQLLLERGDRVRRYTSGEVSVSLQARQRDRLEAFAHKVHWAVELPDAFSGVIVGNEVLDAMPVKLLVRNAGVWNERGVAWDGAAFAWRDRATSLRPPCDVEGAHDYVTELHVQAEAFVRTLADRFERGAAFFIDYGFPEREYYHPQRHMGTLMCHRGHMADPDPLTSVGGKDITAHVNFTGIALAAQQAGWATLGYAAQGRFLLNCGIAKLLADADLPDRAAGHRLIAEHEMGELFKIIGFQKGDWWDAAGFREGDRTDRL